MYFLQLLNFPRFSLLFLSLSFVYLFLSSFLILSLLILSLFFHSASLFLPHPFPLVPLRFQHFDQDIRNRQRSSGDQAYLPPSIITKAKTKREVKSVRQPNSYQAHTCSENCATSDFAASVPNSRRPGGECGSPPVLHRRNCAFWGNLPQEQEKTAELYFCVLYITHYGYLMVLEIMCDL